MIRFYGRVIALCALVLMIASTDADAHLRLASSSPAQGDTIRMPLSEIRLTFTQAVEQRYTVVTLLDAFGNEIAIGTLQPVGASPSKEYVLVLDRPLMAGGFTIKWKTAGADGHAVSGMFDFVVAAARVDGATAAAPAPTTTDHSADQTATAEVPAMYRPESSPFWIGTRWLNFMGLLFMVGAVAFRFGVLERARTRLDAQLVDDLDASVRRLAIIAAVIAILSNWLRVWLQSGSLHGTAQMWQPELLSAMILKTGWGKAWLAQTVAAAGFMVAVLIRSKDRTDSWFSAAAFAVIAASTPAFSGHAAAVQQMAIVPVVDDAVHVITASAWLGTLGVLLLAALPRVARLPDGYTSTSTLVHTFSPFALTMGALAVFTGALNAFVHIGAVNELWTTSYGRVLAIKIGLVVIALTMGAYNWRVMKPRLGASDATSQFKRSASSELAIAVIIVLITAVLVGVPTD